MAWEFVAAPSEDGAGFAWRWKIVADDSGQVIREAQDAFSDLETCIADALKNGFVDTGTRGPEL